MSWWHKRSAPAKAGLIVVAVLLIIAAVSLSTPDGQRGFQEGLREAAPTPASSR